MDSIAVLLGVVVGAAGAYIVLKRREIAARRKTRVITRVPRDAAG